MATVHRAGLDRGVDEFVLADHDADVDDVEALARERVFDDLVADGVTIGTDDAEHDCFRVHSAFCLSCRYVEAEKSMYVSLVV